MGRVQEQFSTAGVVIKGTGQLAKQTGVDITHGIEGHTKEVGSWDEEQPHPPETKDFTKVDEYSGRANVGKVF